ncbi:MAG: MATE family efflux transporter [Moorea sp. SIO3I7]|uniref:guanitoxin biosynthesis MATE family efflux transporter GntT n=1 Tax=unclassified Moorena TaxID=2683338 RepID=UPI0013C04BBB|nr:MULTISPECIES: guanitoxin biosynthesis MATE family efflux transporter GntT [unclassified Moorena]NEN94004.1 MATE family efflux transporter [Moorena sp. SIO3I7]NEO05207.1 MATE family efflux transporter [Moorena sp. SIO3I8]NEO18182.1 MATE family efflux transporter [Moorena sp. SIO4A5]NEP21577.1 MATE family efflux transporter [Moorena sp. SIO3I6]NEQ60437.1 MATE family efflux transporter [Moorena sp. SIO4A1]
MNFTLPSQYDFLPRFYRLVLTNILSSIIVPLSGLIDLAFLGHLSDIRYLAGVALAGIVFSYLYRVLKFLRSSTTGMTAQAMGAEDDEAMLLILLRNGLIALGLALLILTLQYPLQKLGFTFLVGSMEVKDAGLDYFNARIWGAPAVLLNFVLIGWLFGREMNSFVLVLSVIESVANVVLDYIFIIRWGWGSTGAGVTTAISQYLMLLGGLTVVCFHIDWSAVLATIKKVLDWSVIKATSKLNGNLLVQSLTQVTTLSIFTNLSSAMGVIVLVQNTVLLQAAALCLFVVQGVGFATQSLAGNFKGQGASSQLANLAVIAGMTSLFIALSLAGVCILFPNSVFTLLTNHTEVTENIYRYLLWLLPFQIFSALTSSLEGYFVGLTEGKILRNSSLAAFSIGFVPLAIAAWYWHSNNLLWFAMCLYSLVRAIALGVKLLETLRDDLGNATTTSTAS